MQEIHLFSVSPGINSLENKSQKWMGSCFSIQAAYLRNTVWHVKAIDRMVLSRLQGYEYLELLLSLFNKTMYMIISFIREKKTCVCVIFAY